MANRIDLLFLAAEPVDTVHSMRLGEEIREIEHKINSAPKGKLFNIVQKWAVRPQDLAMALMRYRPTIVHFSGHASANEIFLEDDRGKMKPFASERLESMLSVFSDTLRIVFLNACYTDGQLAGLSRIIEYTIGTNKALSDKVAIQFSASFYQGLAFGHSVPAALELAQCQVDVEPPAESDIFTLRVREGTVASQPFVKAMTKNVPSTRIRLQSLTSTGTKKKERPAATLPKTAQISSHPVNQRSIDRQSRSIAQPTNAVRDLSADLAPVEIRESLKQFRADHPDPSRVAFLMMRFGTTKAHKDITAAIRKALDPLGITALRADDKQYHDDLFPNVLTYAYGCGFGIAVFERIETEEFNPNVALEVGYMFALKKPICLIKDKTLKTLQTDLVGKLYRIFDPLDPVGTIPPEISQRLKDKGL